MSIPITPHGTRELAITTLVCGFAAWGLSHVAWPLALVPAALFGFTLAFFRDPERKLPADPSTLVSPADGTISDVVELPGSALMAEPCLRVGIFLSVLDVHVNRCPMSGEVAALHHRPGKFLDARHPDCSAQNEAQEIRLDGAFPVVVRQIAGLIARRIVCPLKVGQRLERGQRMGMIKFGSRTELLVPLRLKPVALVKVGDKVRGTATALVRVAAPAA